MFIIVIRRSTVLRKCEALSPPACVDPPLENHTDFRAQKVLNVGLLFLNPALLKPFYCVLGLLRVSRSQQTCPCKDLRLVDRTAHDPPGT